MSYNRFEPISATNPRPVQEAEGTYSDRNPISLTNPFPGMIVDAEYTDREDVSESNPLPCVIVEGGSYSQFSEESDSNPLPVKIIEGQNYSRFLPISETNPFPIAAESEYVGPLDLVPGAVVAEGLFAMSAARIGEPLVSLRRGDDETLQLDAGEDGLPVTAEISAFQGAPIELSCTLTEASQVVTTASTAALAVGMVVSGVTQNNANVKSDHIRRIVDETTFWIGGASANNETVSLTFYPELFVSEISKQVGAGVLAAAEDYPSGEGIARLGLEGFPLAVMGFAMPVDGGRFVYGGAHDITWADGEFTAIIIAAATSVVRRCLGDSQYVAVLADGGIGQCDAYDQNDNEAGGYGTDNITEDVGKIRIYAFSWEFGAGRSEVDGVDTEYEGGLDSGEALGPFSTEQDSMTSNASGAAPDHWIGTIVWPFRLTNEQLSAVAANIAAIINLT